VPEADELAVDPPDFRVGFSTMPLQQGFRLPSSTATAELQAPAGGQPGLGALRGSPVLSVWQPTDSIIYGNDPADHLHRELGITRPSWAAQDVDNIPVWGDLLYIFDDPA
jgi:hypothetical protein